MGYEAHVKHIEKLDEKFEPSFYRNTSRKELLEKIQEQKLDIVVACMNSPEKLSSYTIKFMCKCLLSMIKDEHKLSLAERVKEEDGDIWFCGWNYAHNYCDYDEESILNHMIDELTILARVVETPDYFDDSERFFEKKRAIEDAIEIDESIWEMINHEIIDFYGTTNKEEEEELRKELMPTKQTEDKQDRCAKCGNITCIDCVGCENEECNNIECKCKK